MRTAIWVGIAVGGALVVALAVASLVLWWRGRREDARALTGFVPDCVRLAWRLVRDPRVRPWRKLTLLLLIGYLANPIDLLPGSPIDDLLVAAVLLRLALHGQGMLVRELWPGPQVSLEALLRLIERRPRSAT